LPRDAAREKFRSQIVARRNREAARVDLEVRALATMLGAGAKDANAHWREQPRVPAGERDGGQWTAEGAGDGDAGASEETRLAQARGPRRPIEQRFRRDFCDRQHEADLNLCCRLRSAPCCEQANN
jgi:hypothetical protein